jgi:hypothetical protein
MLPCPRFQLHVNFLLMLPNSFQHPVLFVLCHAFDVHDPVTNGTDLHVSSKISMNLYLINATSLAKADAIQQLGLDLVNTNTHVALVSETWFNDEHGDDLLSIPNYSLVRRDRFKRKGGGVCLYIRLDVMYELLPNNNVDITVEIQWVKCTHASYSYYIACCYHPPKPAYSTDDFKLSLLRGIDYINNLAHDDKYEEVLIIAGDFNTLDCQFLETQCGLVQIVKDPTHCTNVLDKVFISRPDMFSASVIKSLIKTKHKAVIVQGSNSKHIDETRKTVKLYDLRAHNIDRLRYHVLTCRMCMTCLFIRHIISSTNQFLFDSSKWVVKTQPFSLLWLKYFSKSETDFASEGGLRRQTFWQFVLTQ